LHWLQQPDSPAGCTIHHQNCCFCSPPKLPANRHSRIARIGCRIATTKYLDVALAALIPYCPDRPHDPNSASPSTACALASAALKWHLWNVDHATTWHAFRQTGFELDLSASFVSQTKYLIAIQLVPIPLSGPVNQQSGAILASKGWRTLRDFLLRHRWRFRDNLTQFAVST
jgi:hypothetical protein